ncbi:MAG: amino acid adenylation domain-containing protein [Myxococcales bacterium]|nr:amino acid adenylation domain-containing protein [Myxococcales bacterium]
MPGQAPRSDESPSPQLEAVGLYERFARQVRARPDALAIDAGDVCITYAELDRRAARMAQALRARGVGDETPVGVFMGPRVEQIVAQVAICRVGATYVPLDPEYPRERLEFMLADAAISVIVGDAHTRGLSSGAAVTLCVDADAPELAATGPAPALAAAAGPDHRTHILYTSGSTGRPKGIELLARGVARLVVDTDYIRFAPGDRVAQIANFSFDAATFEVWGALLNGATLVPIPRHSALDPPALREALRRRRIDVLLLTTALFNLVAGACPDAFAEVRDLLIGGEKANLQAVRAVLTTAPPRRLINAYGPTEATVIATTCDLGPAHLAEGVIPIGRPIASTRVFVLDDQRRPVAVGEPGELHIAGDGLARGYLRRPTLNAEKFIHAADLVPGRELRLYRTGDLVRWRPDGALEFLGRADFQVKIRGVRVEIEEVEAALLATELLVDAAVTAQPGLHDDTQLVAHVVPRGLDLRVAELQARLQSALPRAMIPARFVVVAALPLNANGKVDRKALSLGQAQSGVFSLAAVRAALDPLTAELAALWADLLGVDVVRPDDDFFALGGDSLLAARLVLRVRDAWQVPLPIHALYTSGSLRSCAALLREALGGEQAHLPSPDGPEIWQADARLPADVRAQIDRALISPAPLADWRTGDAFVTGATGFLGAHLIADLLLHTSARVHCLVRARDTADGAHRLLSALARRGVWHDGFAGRLHIVVGDLERRRFGLAPAEFDALAAAVDVVFHCGAHVNYVQPYAAHRAANVAGTAEAIRFAAAGKIKPLHHVSSIAVFGPSGFFGGKPRVHEDDDIGEHLQYLPFDIGYSASKWVSEQLVWAAMRAGLPAAVHRPGFIMGDSRSGAGNPDDFMGRCIRGSIRVGAYPVLPRQRKEFVPVDWVSRAIVHIAEDPRELGRAFHLVPPDPRDSIDLEAFFGTIADAGYPLARRSYNDWVELIVADAGTGASPLCPLVPLLLEQVHSDHLTRWQLHEGMPIYDASNTARALAGSGLVFRPLDRGLMQVYLRRLVADGLLPLPRSAPEPARLQVG